MIRETKARNSAEESEATIDDWGSSFAMAVAICVADDVVVCTAKFREMTFHTGLRNNAHCNLQVSKYDSIFLEHALICQWVENCLWDGSQGRHLMGH